MLIMSMPAKICSACLATFQSGLGDVLEKTFNKECEHHATFVGFREAVVQECFFCVKLWDSIRDRVLRGWENGTITWLPLKCSLSRRLWVLRKHEAFYWHIVYMEFDLQQLDLWHLNYQGNVFCLLMNSDDKKVIAAEDTHESSTASATVHELAYKWYNVCHESHQTCKKLGSSKHYTPTRLIDVGTDGDDTWKLCLSPKDITDFPNYMTLSYRWAKDPTVLLLSSTIDNFRRGTPISGLPKTFRDAITVARRFSIRYLWIDSLCIIQDSPEDWARESTLMHNVYANSSCNIAASASESPEGGLFRSRTSDETSFGYISVDLPTLGTKTFEIWDQFYMDRLTHGPLTDRGWVFQERILSPRVLHFSHSQIAWECFEMSKCEIFPYWSPYPTELNGSRGIKMFYAFFDPATTGYLPPREEDEEKAMRSGVYDQWTHLVKEYTRCAFTCPDDRLIAMEGIAKIFERHTGDEYLAGLWRSRLVEGLNWVVPNPVARPQIRSRVPSWSWAAVDSDVLPQSVNSPRDDDLIEVITATVENPNTTAGWRQVRGCIELRGCLTKATIKEGCGRIGQFSNGSATPIKLEGFLSKLFVLPDTTDVTFVAGEDLYLLPLRSSLRQRIDEAALSSTVVIVEGMILEFCAGKNDVYRRTGRFVVDDLDHVGFLGLRTFLPWPKAVAHNVVMDEARTSVISLV